MADFELIMRPGVDPHGAPNKPPLPPADYQRVEEQGLLIERNLAVPLRDGTRIYVDVYRPADRPVDLPLLLGWILIEKCLLSPGQSSTPVWRQH
jgi:predicted acyl esterase